MSIDQCRDSGQQFVKRALPTLIAVRSELPTIPSFAVTQDSRGRTRFQEGTQPNWWQVPKPAWRSLLRTGEGRAFATSIARTAPFSLAIGKELRIRERGRGNSSLSADYMLKEIVRSYLFAAGTRRWQPTTFSRVWSSCCDYFDPSVKQLAYAMYAPIWGAVGVRRRLSLGDGLRIQMLSAARRAHIASLDSELAGVTARHRFRLWPSCFLVKDVLLEKRIRTKSAKHALHPAGSEWYSELNQEVVLLRVFLNHEISVPSYRLVFDAYPRDGGGGEIPDMPWRPRSPFFNTRPSPQAALRYARLRRRFRELEGSPGWPAVSASMRRFAVAWENPFSSDALADVVAALEGLLVRDKQEVSYKLRVRASSLLGRGQADRVRISKDVKDAYEYRSRVAHGGLVFDDVREWEAAKAMKLAKGKHGNPFHDVNEVHRLKHLLSRYYRAALSVMLRSGELEVNWIERAL